jgi:hypothetical protein
MRFIAVFGVVLGLLCEATAAHADSPGNGATFESNAEIDFAVDGIGDQYELTIGRDAALAQPVYGKTDPDDLGMWSVVPDDEGIAPGTYYWRACWTDYGFTSGAYFQRVCSTVRTLVIVPSKPRWGSPRDGAHRPSNAEIEFRGGHGSGERYRLKIARDPALQELVYNHADPYDTGQWFVVPGNRGMGRGRYYWQACWLDFDGRRLCTSVRRLVVTRPRVPTLTFDDARALVRSVLYRKGGPDWAALSGGRYGCRRQSRTRMACRPSGFAGDFAFNGRLRMRNRINGRTRVSGRLTFFDEYCAAVTPNRRCRSSKRVRGVYRT